MEIRLSEVADLSVMLTGFDSRFERLVESQSLLQLNQMDPLMPENRGKIFRNIL